MTLAQTLPGTIVRITALTASGPTMLRLAEMGLTAGALVRVTRRAPFGGPLEIEVRSTRLCLRRADAACFSVGDSA